MVVLGLGCAPAGWVVDGYISYVVATSSSCGYYSF